MQQEQKSSLETLDSAAHKPSSGNFFPTLDGVRGLAVTSVVAFHTIYLNPKVPLENAAFSLVKAGWMGVPIFFVLSGFLISHTVFKSRDNFEVFPYALRRAAKIIPPFYLSIFIFCVFFYFWKGTPGLVWSALAFATTAAHFINNEPDVNVVYWTLYIEIHFYVLFPLVYFALRRITLHAEFAVFAIFAIVPFLIRICAYPHGTMDWQQRFGMANYFPRAFDGFSLGIAFSALLANPGCRKWMASRAPAFAAAGVFLLCGTYLVFAYLDLRAGPSGLLHGNSPASIYEAFHFLPALSTFLILFTVFLQPKNLLYRFLTWTPLSFTGIISYEWFLFHRPPALFISQHLPDASGNALIYLARTFLPDLLTYAMAVLIYFFYSGPILGYTKRWLDRRRAPSD
jgi:peptidoglycan/LPS O-acetylase OafA/YrhL